MKHKIIGYFMDKDEEPCASTVFVAIDEIADMEGNITSYCPVGQHSAMSREYLEECTPISKEDYIKYSDEIYTPKDYL